MKCKLQIIMRRTILPPETTHPDKSGQTTGKKKRSALSKEGHANERLGLGNIFFLFLDLPSISNRGQV